MDQIQQQRDSTIGQRERLLAAGKTAGDGGNRERPVDGALAGTGEATAMMSYDLWRGNVSADNWKDSLRGG